jgi:hypothetical protein
MVAGNDIGVVDDRFEPGRRIGWDLSHERRRDEQKEDDGDEGNRGHRHHRPPGIVG